MRGTGARPSCFSRFMPIIRTFAPFVAGIGRCSAQTTSPPTTWRRLPWVTMFIWGGYLFGNVPLIKNNFGIVTVLVVARSRCCPSCGDSQASAADLDGSVPDRSSRLSRDFPRSISDAGAHRQSTSASRLDFNGPPGCGNGSYSAG